MNYIEVPTIRQHIIFCKNRDCESTKNMLK